MAKKATGRTAKEKKTEIVYCINCAFAYLMQYLNHPIIAGCKKSHQREVAKAPRTCVYYEVNKNPGEIHSMIFANKKRSSN